MINGRSKKLDVSIRPVKDKVLKKIVYRIVIDGDVFWADSYDHALTCVFRILLRDEFSKSKLN